MERLIKRYRRMPSPTNRQRLVAHIAKHGVRDLEPENVDFLRAHEFI